MRTVFLIAAILVTLDRTIFAQNGGVVTAVNIQDTMLGLRDGNGPLVTFNDNWETDTEAQVLFSNEAPTDPREAAIVRTLPPGHYTVVVRGKNETVGIALLEVYVLP